MTKKHKRSPYEEPYDDTAKPPMLAPRKRPFPQKPRATSNASEGAAVVVVAPSGTPPRERMSIEELEQKKMLLPYLDKIEYINVQLRQRGLLPDDSTPPRFHPGALSPPAATGKDPIRQRLTKTKPLATEEHGEPTSTSRNQDATPHGVTRQRSESQLVVPTHDLPLVKRTKVAADSLRLRYPRLYNTIDRTRPTTLSPRIRPMNWLLRLIEEIYDALTEMFILGATSGTVEATNDGSPRPEIVDTAGRSTPPPRLFQPRLVMPQLVRQHIENTLGLPHLADQECLDLLYNVEATVETFASVAMFSMFVREIYDEDTLLFYLFVRLIVQREFDVQLKAKLKVAHSSLTGKKFVAGDVVRFEAHPLIPDGSKTVQLTRAGCEQVWKRFFMHAASMKSNAAARMGTRTPSSPVVLGHYVTTEGMAELFNAEDHVAVEHLLVWSVDAFRNIAEDIIAQFKFKDDGESLRGLIRLRETISSDAKISKLTTLYSERERSLRNMKMDLLRLERSNTEDNKNRTQLRLLRNQIGLVEQELEHIRTQVAAAEALVNDVWRDVTSSSPTKSQTASRVARSGDFVNSSKELPSVLGRFAAHIARLQRKHDIEVKAASMLAKPWKQQMEELQLRMVIRIQRAYRARRRAREIKQKAKEELHEQIRLREIQKQNEFLERKRQEANQEKDVQRHQARMLAKQQQELAARDAVLRKQQQLVERMRLEQIAERDRERNTKLVGRILKQWITYVSMIKKKRNANRLFMKFEFMRWRHHFMAFKRIDSAARLIQRGFRRRQERVVLRKAFLMRKKRNNMAKRYLQKIQSRLTQRVFNKWMDWTLDRIRLRANVQTVLRRRTGDWFQRWVQFVQHAKLRRLQAVVLVQCMYRGRLARHVVQAQRLRIKCSQSIQRVYRGHRGRQAAALRRRNKIHQDTHCGLLLHRIRSRALSICVATWREYAHQASHIKRISARRRLRQLHDVFGGFLLYRQYKREKRAAFYRRQYEGAVLIQRHYRRHRCQVVFRTSLVCHRAAIKIQRVFRGYQGRQRVQKLRWEIAAAKKLQSAWRQRQAWRLAEKTRSEAILLAAFKGDFTATQRAIVNGYWYVVDDEHNGILHMAAAAGHKRLVKLCLRHRMDINAVNVHGQTPLHLLLANIPPLIPGFDEDGETQRIVDARVGLAAYMIDHNAWHEAPDELGITPLLLSSALGQTDATEMLLEKSANTDARSVAGLNAAQLCVEGNHSQTLRVLLASRGFDNEANATHTLRLLHACAGRGLIDCLRVLVDHLSVYELAPNQLDQRDDDGYTPLIYGISNSNVDAVRCLLESGASPDEKDFFGRSPLHFAVTAREIGSPAIVELLTMYDVDVNVKDTDGDSALHTSCDRDARLECTSLLLRSGAVICGNTLGNHPTHIAARNGAVETLKLLVEYGADMNIKNYEGKTPLGLARMLNQKPVVQYIKQYFAAESMPQKEDGTEEHSEELDVSEEHTGAGDDEYPKRTQAEWEVALRSAYKMGTLAEWTHYVDAETEISFYACQLESETETMWQCTWDTPIEFDAALGDTWEVMRKGGSGVALRSRLPPEITTEDSKADASSPAGGSPRTRAGLGVQYLYLNKRTGETRVAVPPIDYSLLQDVVQNSKRRQQLRQRIRKVSSDTGMSAMEYMRFFHEFEAETAQTRAETIAAITIQRHYRAKCTKRIVRTLLFENKCAVELQRAFRGRQARKTAALRRHEHVCATKIQALWRGHCARVRERTALHSERVRHRHQRLCAVSIQRVFRGHQARRLAYRERVIQKHGPRGYFEWEQARRQATVKQSYKVWDEMELREFPGVYFYCHHVTRACAWEKSKEWQAYDVEQFHERCQLFRWGYTQKMKRAAIRLQSLWRTRQARIAFRLIMKSVQIMKSAEREYLDDPTNLVKMGNYVLFLHAVLHDYERARHIYGRLMRTMAQRGPDVPFILFSYALFLFVTQEDDVALVEDMIARAKAQDRQLIKYKMAFLGFFRQSMLQNPQDSESNLNYAACLQWLFEQYDESVPYYLRAIATNPHKKGPMELFQDMLNRKKQVDKARQPSLFAKPTGKLGRRTRDQDDELLARYDAFEMFRRWQVQQAEEDDLRRRRQFEADKAIADRLQAARKIQARYRRRQAMRKVNRLRVERQMAISMADLADTQAVYERVRLAFDQVAAAPATTTAATSKFKLPTAKKNAAASAKPMSVPMARLEELFCALDLTLSPDDFRGTMDAFREQYGKALHVSVMDMTSFAQSNALVAAQLKEKRKAPAGKAPPR